MTSRVVPQHKFVDGLNSRCSWRFPGGWHRSSSKYHVCNLLASDTAHRFYPCRKGCDEESLSVESRDRHEANAHGNGW
jgi:hypothetical protein